MLDRLAQFSARRRSPAGVLGGEVLPEEGVVDVAAAVEVDERLEGDLLRGGGRGGEFVRSRVVGCYVCLVVVFVVELHYAAGDGGLEGGVVVCRGEKGGWLVESLRGKL